MEKSMDMFIKPGLYRGFLFWECNEWDADATKTFLRPLYTRTPWFPGRACTEVIGMI